MKLHLGEKKVVVQGVRPEENMWGIYQFPRICKNGNELIVEVHMGEDRIDELDAKGYFSSSDGGETWVRCQSDRFYDVEAANEDKLFFPALGGVDISHYKFPKFIYQMLPSEDWVKAAPGCLPLASGEAAAHGAGDWVYMRYTYDQELCPDGLDDMTWTVKRNGVVEKAPVDWPHKPECAIRFKEDKELWLGGNWPICDKKRAPDGTLWVTTYTAQTLDPQDGRFAPFSSIYIFVSQDNGKHFRLHSHIPYHPEEIDHRERYLFGGFNESSIEFAPDGSMILLARVNDVDHRGRSWSPMFLMRSTDGGITWSKPVEFDRRGVLPKTCQLDSGRILAIYGRPGIYVRATNDPAGLCWEEPVEVMTPEDRSAAISYFDHGQPFHRWVGSCCNCDIVATGENTAMIVYSDFYYPDQAEPEKLRKTILVQTVTVEE